MQAENGTDATLRRIALEALRQFTSRHSTGLEKNLVWANISRPAAQHPRGRKRSMYLDTPSLFVLSTRDGVAVLKLQIDLA